MGVRREKWDGEEKQDKIKERERETCLRRKEGFCVLEGNVYRNSRGVVVEGTQRRDDGVLIVEGKGRGV